MIPLDSNSLLLLREAATTGLTEELLPAGDFTLPMLLDFWSGAGAGTEQDGVFEHDVPLITANNVIVALVDEVLRLRHDQ